ncbi:MAG TPA: sigma-70 family RNA polymerase sigma factor [Verrucomicrobiae bacterium]|nr:sigma-70 family RNA polymerase sigma factor [Verrucomicrobiae bacterium]
MLQRCGDGLFLYARQLCRNDADAADVVQEAFLRIWRKHANNGVTEPDLSALCYAAVRYTVLDRQRQAARQHRREVTAGESWYSQPSMFVSPLEQTEEHARLEAAIRCLPVEQQEVLTLKVWGELTFQQIATVMDESPNTTASRYRLALAALRQQLAKAGTP